MEPERRHLTVMFCDLVGSTALSERLDPEDMRSLIRVYRETCHNVIKRYDGFVARYLGDGILIYFGYPQAHEDDAERAVRTGLDIITAIADLRQTSDNSHGRDLSVRVGIASGLVVAGDIVGDGTTEEMAVVGSAPNLAARLQSQAEPNGIIISEATRRLLGAQFVFESKGEKAIKGFSEPVQIWRVVVQIEGISRFEAKRDRGLTPLAGRNNELAELRACLHRSMRSEGNVVTICGEPGIGKSRIIRALLDDEAAGTCTRIILQCSPFRSNSALYPFLAGLAHAAALESAPTAEGKLAQLREHLTAVGVSIEAALPLFAELLALPYTGPERQAYDDPQVLKERMLAAFVGYYERLARDNATIMVLEDAHWIDPTSLELLDLLNPLLASVRMLLIVSFRPEFPSRWTDQPHLTSLTLNRLGRDDCLAMVHYLDRDGRLSPEIVDRFVDKADGMPLFIEELTRAVLGSRSPAEEGGTAQADAVSPELALPDTLHDLLQARLDQLDHDKRIAQTAAILGREFSSDLLAQLAEITEAELACALDRLVESGLVFVLKKKPRAAYGFKHALIRDAAYESLLRSDRKRLHARAGELLAARFEAVGEIAPEVIAYHFTKAGLAEPAVKFWGLAGKRALARSANADVIAHMNAGLRCLTELPASLRRARSELEFHIALGAAYWVNKGFASDEVEQSFSRALELCPDVGDDAQLMTILRGLHGCYYARGQILRAKQQAERIYALSRRTNDASNLMVGHMLLGQSYFWLGEFPRARKELDEAMSLYRRSEQQTKTLSAQIDPGVNALVHLGWTLWMLGYPDQGVETVLESLERAESLALPFTVAMSLFWVCAVHALCGQLDQTERYTSYLREVTTAHDIAFLGACATVLEGQILIEKGDIVGGLPRLQQAIQEFGAQQAGLGRPWMISVLVAALGRIGRAEQGLGLLREAFTSIEKNGERQWEAELHRLKGELLLALPDQKTEEARTALEKALSVAERQQAKSFELRAVMSLARLLRDEGKRTEAKRLVSDVYDWFTEGFETADLKAARAVLAQIY